MSRQAQYILLLILLGFTCLSMLRLVRFERKGDNPLDLRQIYIGAKLAHDHLDPYNDHLLKQTWTETTLTQGITTELLPGGEENYLLYPPSFTMLFGAASRMDWKTFGNIGWCFAGISLLGFILLCAYSPGNNSSNLLLAGGLIIGFKGTVPALLLAQPLFLSAMLIAASLVFIRVDKPFAGALLLALAALKPSLVIPVIFYLAFIKEYKVLGLFAIFIILFQVPVFLEYGNKTPIIYTSWLNNMSLQQKVIETSGHEFLAGNMTNLRAAWFGWTGSKMPVPELALLVISSVGIYLLAKKKQLEKSLVLLLFLLTAFLFSYHLYYDLLLLALCIPFLSKRPWAESLLFLPLYLPLSYLPDSSLTRFHIPVTLLVILGYYLAVAARKKRV